jgi:hypothetical protein
MGKKFLIARVEQLEADFVRAENERAESVKRIKFLEDFKHEIEKQLGLEKPETVLTE